MSKIKNKKVIIIASILLLITLVVGITYAAFNYDFLGEKNVIGTGEISIEFLESNDVISVTNVLPMSDDEGTRQTDTFGFQVKTKANGNISLKYVLGIEKLTVSAGYTGLNDDQVKVYLTDYNDNMLVGPTLIKDLGTELYSKTNTHSKEKTEITDKYKIRVWVDKQVDSSNWDENTKLEYKFKINVNSNQAEKEYKTVLYNDGTLIINELEDDRSTNITKHGEVTKEYAPMSDKNAYVVHNPDFLLWYNERLSIKQVEIGSKISPRNTAYWFYGLSNMTTGDFTKLNTSNVADMSEMFHGAGQGASTFELIGLENWNTSSVTNMEYMFRYAGMTVTTFDIGDLSGWDTSNVTNMSGMFEGAAGRWAETFNIGDLSGWNTSKVTNMSNMFNGAGNEAPWSLDCSKWNVNKVTSHTDFSDESKVTPPVWVN